MTTTSPVLKQIAGLPKLSHAELKALWREYFGVEPPAYRRGFLVRGLAHRLQELTYGGLKPAYQARLDAMIAGTEKPNGTGRPGRRARQDINLLEGTKLLRDWRGVTHEVTVIDGGYEHQGRRYRSLSAVARAITGTQWSGPLFFGLRKTGRAAHEPARGQAQGPLRDLHPEVERGGSGAGLQQPRRPARGLRGLHRQPAP